MEFPGLSTSGRSPHLRKPPCESTQRRLRVERPAARWKLVASRRDSFSSSHCTRRLRAGLSHAAASRLDFAGSCFTVVRESCALTQRKARWVGQPANFRLSISDCGLGTLISGSGRDSSTRVRIRSRSLRMTRCWDQISQGDGVPTQRKRALGGAAS